MKRLILLVVLSTAACAPKPLTLTPAGQTAFTADQAVVRVNELMNAAIQANASGALDTPTTRIIVSFAVDADAVLAKTPDGWKATIKAAWAQAKPTLSAIPANSTVALALAAADAAIGGL